MTVTLSSRPALVVLGVLAALLCACGATSAIPQPITAEQVDTPRGSSGTNHPSVLERNYVVLVSFDGFRPDYLDRFDTRGFDRLARTGVVADGLTSVFPSLTFPSHYSIATGLYPEHHGIIGNRFYDPVRAEEFNRRESEDVQDGSWWGGEPIWITAERQGMVAAAQFFPGSEAPIDDVRPTHWRPYVSRVRNADRVEQVLEWLTWSPAERPLLITVYFSLVDSAGHAEGPDGPRVGRAVGSADRLMEQLLDGIERLAFGDQVYLVVVSDHGMTQVRAERQIVLREAVDLRGVRAVPLGPAMSLHVGDDAARGKQLRDQFNARASGAARAYVRGEIPEHLHARASPRIGDILVVPEEGVSVVFRRDATPPAGRHGWDPTLPSMHGIFLMRGPRLSPGQRIAAFESVHVYPLIAHVLALRPNADIDGDLEILGSLLSHIP